MWAFVQASAHMSAAVRTSAWGLEVFLSILGTFGFWMFLYTDLMCDHLLSIVAIKKVRIQAAQKFFSYAVPAVASKLPVNSSPLAQDICLNLTRQHCLSNGLSLVLMPCY